jgi:hypothetical protein
MGKRSEKRNAKLAKKKTFGVGIGKGLLASKTMIPSRVVARPALVRRPLVAPRLGVGKAGDRRMGASKNYFSALQEAEEFVFGPSILEGGARAGAQPPASPAAPASWPSRGAAAAASAPPSLDLSTFSSMLPRAGAAAAPSSSESARALAAGGWDFSAFGKAAEEAAVVVDGAGGAAAPASGSAAAAAAVSSAAFAREAEDDAELLQKAARQELSHKKRVRLMSVARRGDAYAGRVEAKVMRREAARKRRNKASW